VREDLQAVFGEPWNNQGLFSRNFLETRIQQEPYWDCDERAAHLLEEIARIYREDYEPVRQDQNEEDTRHEWIDPVLEAMGQAGSPRGSVQETTAGMFAA